jgi:tRNA U55 pseudouridine synthase TruB
MGATLGCGATMSALVRTQCGALRVEDSIDPAELTEPSQVRPHLISPDRALSKFPGITLSDSEVGAWMTGRPVRGGGILAASGQFEKDSMLRIKSRDGRLVGLAKSLFSSVQLEKLGGDLEVLKPVRVFPKPYASEPRL